VNRLAKRSNHYQCLLAILIAGSSFSITGCQLPGTESGPQPPAAASKVTATAGSSAVLLSWTPVVSMNQVTYSVKRSTSSSGSFVTIASGIKDSTYLDSSATNGQTYFYIVTATDVNGSTDAVQVSASPAPAAVAFTNTVAEQSINSLNHNNFILRGTCSPDKTTVRFSGAVVSSTPCSNGFFSKGFDLSGLGDETVNGYTVLADLSDAMGSNAAQATLILKKDTVSPTVSLTSPADGTFDSGSTIDVTGQCSQNGLPVNIEITDGITTSKPGSAVLCNTGVTPNFTATLDIFKMNPGMTLKVSHSDSAGNIASITPIAVTRAVNIVSQGYKLYVGTSTNSTTYPITGFCSFNNRQITLTLNGSTIATPTCTSGQYSATINTTTLGDGDHSLQANITSTTGTVYNSSVITLVKDVSPPPIAFTAPASNAQISLANVPKMTVSGTCSSTFGDQILVTAKNGSQTISSAAGLICKSSAFSTTLDISSLSEGAVTLSAVATDRTLNTTTATRTVTKDTIPPVLAFTSPSSVNNKIHNGNNVSSFSVTGTCNVNGRSVMVRLNGTSISGASGVVCTSGTFSTTMNAATLAQGSHTLSASMSDSALNAVSSTLIISKDTGASGIAVSFPTSNLTAGLGQTVTVSVVDSSGFPAKTYAGAISFTASDIQATVPEHYFYTSADQGTHTFINGVVFKTAGTHTLTVTDLINRSRTKTVSDIVVIPSSASLSKSSISAAPNNDIFADGNTVSTISITLKDSFGNPLSGISPVLSASGTGNTFTQPAPTDLNGMTKGTIRSTVGESKSIFISSPSSVSGLSTSVVFGGVASHPGTSTVTSSLNFSGAPSSLEADGAAAATITVTARNNAGRLLSGRLFTLTSNRGPSDLITPPSGITGYDGTIEFLVKSTSAGTLTLTATDTEAQININGPQVTFRATSATQLAVSGLPSSQTAGTPKSLTVTIRDGNGNVATSYRGRIAINSTDPQSALPSLYQFTLSDSGVHTFTNGVILKSAGSQYITVTDILNSSITATTPAVNVVAADPSNATSIIASNPNSHIIADGTSVSSITVTFKDQYGNPVSGVTPTLTSTGTGNTLVQAGASNTSGQAIATLTSTVPEAKTIRISSPTGFSSLGTVIVFGSHLTDPAVSLVETTANIVPTDPASSAIVTATVKNELGTALPGKQVTLISTRGSSVDSISPSTATSDASGKAVFTVKSTATGNANFTASVITDNTVIMPSAVNITFIRPADTDVSTISIAPSLLNADGNSVATITVVVKDNTGEEMSGRSVSLTSSRGAADIIAPAPAITNFSGVATFTLKSTSVGVAHLTATVDSVTKTTSARFIDAATPLSGLVLDFTAAHANGTAQYGNGCGNNTWTDLSGSSFNGTLQNFNSCNVNSGWVGSGTPTSPYALAFNGSTGASTTNMVAIPAIGSGLDQISLSAWIKVRKYTGQLQEIYVTDSWMPGNFHVHLTGALNAAQGKLSYAVQGSSTCVSIGSIPKDTWTHVNLVVDTIGKTCKTYINGALDNSQNYSTIPKINLTAGHIGNLPSGLSRALNGQMGSFALHNRSLTATEIKDTFILTAPNYGIIAPALSYDAAKPTGNGGLYATGCALNSHTWYNASSFSHHAALTGFVPESCGASSGWVGDDTVASPYALAFDGSSHYADIGTLPSTLDVTQGVSIEAWINPLFTLSETRTYSILDMSNFGISDRIALGHSTSTNQLFFTTTLADSGKTVFAPDHLNTGAWYHVVATLTPTSAGSTTGTAVIYVNGVPVATSNQMTMPMNISRETNFIGKDGVTEGLFKGKMGKVNFYTRALSASDVLKYYTLGDGNYYETPTEE
jgi:plastocyanin